MDRHPVYLLKPMPSHRSVNLLQHVGTNLRHPIGAHPHDVGVVGGGWILHMDIPFVTR